MDSSIDRLAFGVGFKFWLGAGVDREKGIRFGFDGSDVSAAVNFVGTEDVPQSNAGAHYSAPLTLGERQAAVSYCDYAGQVFTYAWRFTVIE